MDSPTVARGYEDMVSKIREKNSIFRTEAFSAEPIKEDSKLGQRIFYNFDDAAERRACLDLMRQDLKLFRPPWRQNR